jgi:hypothetical protein
VRVRLIREVRQPTGTGPGNGQYALQRALRGRVHQGLDWLVVGGSLRNDELPWFWSWQDRAAAVRWARRGLPFVQGPNTVFLSSRRPRVDRLECALLDWSPCRLMFTESEWYRRLILRHRGPENRSPVVLWPYPIFPQPPGPIDPPQYDVLIYVKNGVFPGVVEALQRRMGRCAVIRYGGYRREELWETARRSRCCCYLADDDRGPLALAEILLCGCPTVGVPTGAPFVEPGRSGLLLSEPTPPEWLDAVQRCQSFDPQAVAALAATQFDPQRIADTVLAALDAARQPDAGCLGPGCPCKQAAAPGTAATPPGSDV